MREIDLEELIGYAEPTVEADAPVEPVRPSKQKRYSQGYYREVWQEVANSETRVQFTPLSTEELAEVRVGSIHDSANQPVAGMRYGDILATKLKQERYADRSCPVNLKLTALLLDRIQLEAAREGVEVSQFIIKCVEEALMKRFERRRVF